MLGSPRSCNCVAVFSRSHRDLKWIIMKDVKRSTSNSRDRSTRKIRKILNEEARLGIDGNSDSETEAVDLQKELHPLSHYINNRDKMVEEMFSIIKGPKLRKMIPSILKDTPLDELKADCLIHLLGMSKKRILAILEGKEINSSSDSETHSDSSASPSKKTKGCVKPIVIKQEGCSDISDNSEEVVLVEPDLVLQDASASSKNVKDSSAGSAKCKRHHKQKRKNIEDKSTKSNKRTSHENIKKSEETEADHVLIKSSSEDESDKEAPTQGKTLLEILELEMRARAIRALLHKGGAPGEENNTEQLNQNTTESTSETAKLLKKSKTDEKVTPVKNFRKKKRKNDDVIVITPKVVTIDLTDENDPSNAKTKVISKGKRHIELDNLLNSTENNNTKEVEEANGARVINLEENPGVSEIKSGSEDTSNNKNPTFKEPASSNLDAKKHEPVASEDKKEEQTKSSWAQRWLDSKEVKKVVSTSKICGNIRKRIKSAKLAKKTQETPLNIEVQPKDIQGSVDEYQLLVKTSKTPDLSNEIPVTSTLEESIGVILSEGGIGSPKGKDFKEAESSVEQVQDTKCEPHSNGILQEPAVVCSKFIHNHLPDSHAELGGSDRCNIKTQSHNCELQSSDISSKDVVFQSELLEMGNTKSGVSETGLNQEQGTHNSEFSSENKKSESLKLIPNEDTSSKSNTEGSHPNSDTESVQSDSNNLEINISEVNVSKSSDSNKYTSFETVLSNDSHYKPEMYAPGDKELNICDSDMNDTEPVDDTNVILTKTCQSKLKIDQGPLKNINIKKAESNYICTVSSDENKISTEKRLTEEFPSEHETLEINLTDDDLNIDGNG